MARTDTAEAMLRVEEPANWTPSIRALSIWFPDAGLVSLWISRRYHTPVDRALEAEPTWDPLLNSLRRPPLSTVTHVAAVLEMFTPVHIMTNAFCADGKVANRT